MRVRGGGARERRTRPFFPAGEGSAAYVSARTHREGPGASQDRTQHRHALDIGEEWLSNSRWGRSPNARGPDLGALVVPARGGRKTKRWEQQGEGSNDIDGPNLLTDM